MLDIRLCTWPLLGTNVSGLWFSQPRQRVRCWHFPWPGVLTTSNVPLCSPTGSTLGLPLARAGAAPTTSNVPPRSPMVSTPRLPLARAGAAPTTSNFPPCSPTGSTPRLPSAGLVQCPRPATFPRARQWVRCHDFPQPGLVQHPRPATFPCARQWFRCHDFPRPGLVAWCSAHDQQRSPHARQWVRCCDFPHDQQHSPALTNGFDARTSLGRAGAVPTTSNVPPRSALTTAVAAKGEVYCNAATLRSLHSILRG